MTSIPELKLDPEMVGIAGQIIERKSAAFDPNAFQDGTVLSRSIIS